MSRIRASTTLLLAAAVLLPLGSPASANASRWPQGMCEDVTLNVSRVTGSEDRLLVTGSSPTDSCTIVRTRPQSFPNWTPISGEMAFQTTLQDDAFLCQSVGSVTSDTPTIWVKAEGLTDELKTNWGTFRHVAPSPGLEARVLMEMHTENPSADQVVVATGSFKKPANSGCSNFPQTWTDGTVVFADPNRDDLGL